MRILLADDGALFLAGLVSLVRGRGHVVVGRARDGFEALEQARLLRPHVVLMAVEMPRCSGVEATRLIKAELPETKIVLLTSSAETGALIETVSRGIDGYVVTEMSEDRLAFAIDALVEPGGGSSASPSYVQPVASGAVPQGKE